MNLNLIHLHLDILFRSITQKIILPTEILMSFSSLSDNLLQHTHTTFQKCIDKIAHKTCSNLVWSAIPLNVQLQSKLNLAHIPLSAGTRAKGEPALA